MFLVEPFAFAVNLDASAVDEQMQRLVALDSFRQDRQAAASATEGRMIRNSDLDTEQMRDRSQRPLGLAKRLMEDQMKR